MQSVSHIDRLHCWAHCWSQSQSKNRPHRHPCDDYLILGCLVLIHRDCGAFHFGTWQVLSSKDYKTQISPNYQLRNLQSAVSTTAGTTREEFNRIRREEPELKSIQSLWSLEKISSLVPAL